ncbi:MULTISPECIES: ArsR family transcriptional regulator [Grimontia]|uniref:VpaChn25_0724 family phage protein n=1 Tax=Grimontia TaxID=246861 RepID=UPI001303E1E7|nr:MULTISPECIES: ArsR family transcriptional regulator [Grimontia]MDF2186161.1 ArsR family transcriptional regulator [Grimontia hollisae]WRV98559.1 ArsR family transcriptional regulator [Grimontia sp. NTOU-MAR1]
MTLQTLLQQDRRLVMLRVLNEMPGYEANDSIIDSALDAYGHNVSRDLVRTELSWLAEQLLVTLRDVAGTQVARITQRGIDIATGQATHPAIKRPRPGE